MPTCRRCKEKEAVYALQYLDGDNPTFYLLGNHIRGFGVGKVCDDCRIEIKEDHTNGLPHPLTAEEMFNLPDWWKDNKPHLDGGWENPKVSIKDYNPSICFIWEVSEKTYYIWKNDGGLCQKYQNRFYVA